MSLLGRSRRDLVVRRGKFRYLVHFALIGYILLHVSTFAFELALNTLPGRQGFGLFPIYCCAGIATSSTAANAPTSRQCV